MRNTGILIFDDAEVLDFCGPFEVFSVTNELNNFELFNVFTVSEGRQTIRAKNGLKVQPDHSIRRCPAPDILLIPGGWGTRKLMKNEPMLSWIRTVAARTELLLSVCTGSLVLAKAGLLDGMKATTHHEAITLLGETAPNAEIISDQRFVDNGSVIVSAGISAGIDMCLYVVAKLHGEEVASRTALYMEYAWDREKWR
ncbi:MAG: DJ-1/PfpI family protein [Spirochaetaceae bacterium]|nr:MAG: DJ-1/PfpI family protein [Spirochaetaceae bacterium]